MIRGRDWNDGGTSEVGREPRSMGGGRRGVLKVAPMAGLRGDERIETSNTSRLAGPACSVCFLFNLVSRFLRYPSRCSGSCVKEYVRRNSDG